MSLEASPHQDQDQSTSATPQVPEASVSTRSTRSSNRSKRTAESTTAKGKGKQVDAPRASKRTRRTTAVPLTINEPPKDTKGKKRAAPEPSSEDEAQASTKRPKTGYSLRSKSNLDTTSMPRKNLTAAAKGKLAMKNKAMAMASSSRLPNEDDDVEMKGEEEEGMSMEMLESV
ncbi:hypothetical protein ONZ45_g17818 [Pleurotus djamor]|nr:hypothetical protein ONZ45_g17818 [Pleurotus djamor]